VRRVLLFSSVSFFFVELAACGGGNASHSPPPALSAAASSSSAGPVSSAEPASPAASSSPAATTKKRKRTGAASPPAHDGTKPKNGKPLNPKDNKGRTVFVRGDDQCFVEVKTGTELVDCPPEADDAAFDHCASQIVLDENGTKCFCVTGGPKPPMPNPTPCPAKTK